METGQAIDTGAASAERARREGEIAALDWAAGTVESIGSGLFCAGALLLALLLWLRLAA